MCWRFFTMFLLEGYSATFFCAASGTLVKRTAFARIAFSKSYPTLQNAEHYNITAISMT